MECFATLCSKRAVWPVNGRYREAQSASCGTHLNRCVADLAAFNDPRYHYRRSSDHGVMIYPVESE